MQSSLIHLCDICMKFQDETGNGNSILDGNVEEQAILELAGRGRVSEGYRDKPSDIDF